MEIEWVLDVFVHVSVRLIWWIKGVMYFQSSSPQISHLKSIRCDKGIARETSALKSVTLAELHIDTVDDSN